jgi:DNA polymerase III subunit delta'
MGFDSFKGNPQAVATLREMLALDRVPSSMLFSGPDGVGKKTLALMFAKALNCERGGGDFCGECAACRKSEEMIRASGEDLARRRDTKDANRRVEGLVYFDVQILEPITRFILIEQIRQLRKIAYTRPFELPHRVFVIDPAQAIHWQAIDLLLKVLEEPPVTTHFVLICPNAYELRPTIRSRCHKIPFAPVAETLIEELIQNDGRVPVARQKIAVRIARGSVAAASNLDLPAYEAQRLPWINFLDSVTSHSADSSTAVNWKSLFDSTKALTENREEFEAILQTGYLILRDLLQVLEDGPNGQITNVDLLPRLRVWGEKLGRAGINMVVQGLDQSYRLQSRNVNQQLGLEDIAVEVLERC